MSVISVNIVTLSLKDQSPAGHFVTISPKVPGLKRCVFWHRALVTCTVIDTTLPIPCFKYGKRYIVVCKWFTYIWYKSKPKRYLFVIVLCYMYLIIIARCIAYLVRVRTTFLFYVTCIIMYLIANIIVVL